MAENTLEDPEIKWPGKSQIVRYVTPLTGGSSAEGGGGRSSACSGRNIFYDNRLSGFEFRGRAGLLMLCGGYPDGWVRQNLIYWEKILKDQPRGCA